LNHASQKLYAEKILSFPIDILFVSIGEKERERERTALKEKSFNCQILNVYMVVK
jgi:hypothetical protein